MAFQSIWYYTNLPDKIVDIIEEDLKDNFDPQLQDSRVGGGYGPSNGPGTGGLGGGGGGPTIGGYPGTTNSGGGGSGYPSSGGSGIFIVRYAV
jgi:hypothetical protein